MGISYALSVPLRAHDIPVSVRAVDARLDSSGNMRFANNQLSGTVPTQLTGLFPASSATWSSNCVVNNSALLSGCDIVERSALTDLYTSTGGPYWTVSSGWMSSAHPCTWYGVGCAGGSTTSGPVV